MKWPVTRRSFPWAGGLLVGVAVLADLSGYLIGRSPSCDYSNTPLRLIEMAFVSALLAVISGWLRPPESRPQAWAVRVAPALIVITVVLGFVTFADQFKACL